MERPTNDGASNGGASNGGASDSRRASVVERAAVERAAVERAAAERAAASRALPSQAAASRATERPTFGATDRQWSEPNGGARDDGTSGNGSSCDRAACGELSTKQMSTRKLTHMVCAARETSALGFKEHEAWAHAAAQAKAVQRRQERAGRVVSAPRTSTAVVARCARRASPLIVTGKPAAVESQKAAHSDVVRTGLHASG